MMIQQQAETIQKIAAVAGYGGGGTFFGLYLADIDLILRVAVGVLSCISIAVHLYFKIRSETRKDK